MWDKASNWIMERYVQLERKCAKLTKAEAILLQDLEELKPALDALKFLQHRHNELKAAVKTLNTEVQKLWRQKVALAVGVRATVSWEGEEEMLRTSLGGFVEPPDALLERSKQGRLGFHVFQSTPKTTVNPSHRVLGKLGEARRQTVDDVEMVLQRGGEGNDQGEENEPRGPGWTLVERSRYLADIEGRIEVLLEAARDAEMEEQRSDLQ
ncbi:hypothetical protein R1sor_024268 [Riccia sorocarpa]|uniref:Uncharacterized protein n=1 Tax=Riccia sorocarpa TaxID=122646 RepID=A0ABD3GS96_9MARC